MRPTIHRSGFTLIELLIVVVVLGILAVISIYRVGATSQKAYVATMEADLRALIVQEELFHQIQMRYADIADLTEYSPSRGVTIETPWVEATGFIAIASHASLVNTTCAVFLGPAPAGAADPAEEPGQITCDE